MLIMNSMKKTLNYCTLPLLMCASLSTILLSSCSPSEKTYTYAEAVALVNFPRSMYRGTDYLGSDEEYHYFEYRMELGDNTRFRIPVSALEISETFPYSAWRPQRRNAHELFCAHSQE